MRRVLGVLLLGAVLLGGCSKETPAPIETTKDSVSTGQTAYLTYAKQYTNASDEAILKFGQMVCAAYDSGKDRQYIFEEYVVKEGMDAKLAGQLTGGAVANLCP